MASPSRPPARPPPRARRTQEERSAATRAKVLDAAVDCVDALGFRGATMTALAGRAGVSFGAIQHQFGEKDAIFRAVLERAVDRLRDALVGLREAHPEPDDRVRAFAARCRDLLDGPLYRAFVEIQMNRGREDGEDARAWSHYVAGVLTEAWRDVFGDLDVPRRRLEDAQRFTFAVLSGIATEKMLFPESGFSERHFEILEETLLRLLEPRAAGSGEPCPKRGGEGRRRKP